MICDHDTITDMVLDDYKYVLIYCDSGLIEALFVINNVTSPHIVEVLDSAQELLDRGLALGLTCSPRHLIQAMEHGAVLTAEVEEYLLSVVWDSGHKNVKKMEALGYKKPKTDLNQY